MTLGVLLGSALGVTLGIVLGVVLGADDGAEESDGMEDVLGVLLGEADFDPFFDFFAFLTLSFLFFFIRNLLLLPFIIILPDALFRCISNSLLCLGWAQQTVANANSRSSWTNRAFIVQRFCFCGLFKQ